MTDSKPEISWTEANQACLVAEFAYLKGRLRSGSHAPVKEVMQSAIEPPAAIDRLTEIFGLSTFEREVLLLCAGIEMDSELASECGAAQGLSHAAPTTFGLALGLLTEPHWSALTPSRPLRRFRLVEVDASARGGFAAAPLRIDERVLHYLAGVNVVDQRLQLLLQLSASPTWIAENHRAAAIEILRSLENRVGPVPVFQLCGDDPHGQEDIATLAAQQMGLHLFTVRTEELPPVSPELDQLNILWQREALLLPAGLLLQSGAAGVTPPVRYLLERLPGAVFLGSREPAQLDRVYQRFDVNKPPPIERKRLWEKALGPQGASLNSLLEAVSEQFRLSARTIFSTGTLLSRGATQPGELWNTCRSLARPRLDDLAQRIVPNAGWEDLVLPDLQKQILRQIASQVRHRMIVYQAWGFAAKGCRGLGVSALFTGESGTGKTMAAEVLADELKLDLYRIDLSAVVSKYIGETEKNLKQVFDTAEEGGVILLFDEADALFGKRSDVRDSHDRYANIEVSYLLQRMEAYEGLAILTTNLKSAMDRAFQRRLRFTVNFPFPDAGQREAIWNRAFPVQTSTRGLNHKRLSQLNVTGGNIRNIALNAAFLAAEDGKEKPIEMAHLVRAARLEAEKIQRPLSEPETRGWI
jgi:ATPase family associated with various cellular activities (AAA)